jgi:hypothetical protein
MGRVMAEIVTPAFFMHSTREAMSLGLFHIEKQVIALERAVLEEPGLAFDLAKTLIESACRTILTQRGIASDPGDDLPKLFKDVTQNLSFLPPLARGEASARRSLVQTLRGLSSAVQGVCELRNACGFASHGSDGPRPVMESAQALLAASAADTIIGFLHRIHRQDQASPVVPIVGYDENGSFNDSVDETHGVIRIFDSEFWPSEVLFRMEPESYRIYLAEFQPDTTTETVSQKPEVNDES